MPDFIKIKTCNRQTRHRYPFLNQHSNFRLTVLYLKKVPCLSLWNLMKIYWFDLTSIPMRRLNNNYKHKITPTGLPHTAVHRVIKPELHWINNDTAKRGYDTILTTKTSRKINSTLATHGGEHVANFNSRNIHTKILRFGQLLFMCGYYGSCLTEYKALVYGFVESLNIFLYIYLLYLLLALL